MHGLDTIVSSNNAAQAGANGVPPKRRCSINVHRNFGGDALGVVLHSASTRSTQYIDFKQEFQRNSFDDRCKFNGLDPEQVLEDWEQADPEALDKTVEFYWGYGDGPDEKLTKGYDTAEDA